MTYPQPVSKPMDNHDPSLESPPDAWIASKGEIVQNQGWHDTTDRKTRRGCDRAIFRSKPNWRIGAVWWWRTGEIVAYRVKTVSGQHRRGYFSDGSARWTHDRIRHEIGLILSPPTLSTACE